ncbi:MAG: hypothetical protein HY321_05840 [Armatimonadetes bacterium]|nr:hypothetical protein [Armatimonadota bacterium]
MKSSGAISQRPGAGTRPAARATALPGLSWRAILAGIALILANCYWMVQVSALGTANQIFPEAVSPFFNAIFTLFALTALSALLRRAHPRLGLTVHELIVVYVMVCIGTALCSGDVLQGTVMVMTYPFWAATRENGWADLFHPYIPRWLSVRDPDALQSFYAGHSTLYTPEHLRAWGLPVLCWSLLVFVLLFMMLCANSIVRRHWNEQERLTYPILQLPLAIAHGRPSFFKNRLMWLGFGLAAVTEIINGLAYLTPAIPRTPFNRHHWITPHTFRTRPWSAIWWMDYDLIPTIIGLAFLIRTDLLFSAWFFFILSQFERVAAEALGLGLNDPAGQHYVFSRGFGAYIGLALMQLWLMRGYFREVARTAFRKASGPPESGDGEAIPYRWAVLGLAGGSIFLTLFGLAGGMTPPVILFFFTMYFAMFLVTTRIRAEVGLIGTGLAAPTAGHALASAVGSSAVGPRNLMMCELLLPWDYGHRGNPMPIEMEGIRMAEVSGMRRRGMAGAILIAAAVGTLVSFWLLVHTYYHVGASAATMYGRARDYRYSFAGLASLMRPPGVSPAPGQWANIAAGTGVVLILAALRVRFIGWPLHPVGYAIAPVLNQVWMAVLLVWAIKSAILRYSGRQGYHRALPFFLGLMLGDYTVGMIWTLLGLGLGIPTYNFINL